MGYIAHHAIVVTSGSTKRTAAARAKAIKLGLEVTEIVVSRVNGYRSFLITPDGSNAGREDSERAADARAAWITWSRGMCIDWAFVRFGGDNPEFACLEDRNERPVRMTRYRAKRVTPVPPEGLPAPGPKLKP